jgi:O-methyltransferase
MLIGRIPSAVARRLAGVGRRAALRAGPGYRAFRVAAANSLCDPARLWGLRAVAGRVAQRRIPGHVVECGVYRGGSAIILAERLLRGSPGREMWLFDVFTGMPAPGSRDPAEAWGDVGKFVSSPEIVRDNLAAAAIATDRVHIVPGLYEETVRDFRPPPIAFLHLDCDWYDPVRLCLDTFYDAVSPGGVIVLDDYGFWSGCRKAVDEFVARRCPGTPLVAIDSTSHYFIKP